MRITRPLLAATLENVEDVRFPVLASPKLDGIRCLILNGQALSRTFKPIRNRFIREHLKGLPDGLDGELVLRGYPRGVTFQQITSAVMSEDGDPDFEYWIFDWVEGFLNRPFQTRYEYLSFCLSTRTPGERHGCWQQVRLVPHSKVTDGKSLLRYEADRLAEGYEGIMLRDPNGPYKCGRSTLKEGILLKLKRFVDAEAVIIGFVEQMHNSNEAEENSFGGTKRSHKKEGMIGKGTLGTLLVCDTKTGVEFGVGTGFDDALRDEIWRHRKGYLGKIVVYKSQPCGTKDKPRLPVFKGFRGESDL